ncbi:hypothetical protein K8Q93_01815 [Candidatus Parcubacteria bacterium]|nr:hypothetical protein [Candidatus Parcubacteria bacterium]
MGDLLEGRIPEVGTGGLVKVPNLKGLVDVRRPAARPPKPANEEQARLAHRWWKNQEALPEEKRAKGVTKVEIDDAIDLLESDYPKLAPPQVLPVATSPRLPEKRRPRSKRKK